MNGIWRRIHNKELHSLYHPSNIVRVKKSRRSRWAGHVGRMLEGRSTFKILTITPTGNIPLGRPKRRWEDNIRIDIKEIYVNTRNLVDSTLDYWRSFVKAAFDLRAP